MRQSVDDRAEDELDEIEEGKLKWTDALTEFYDKFKLDLAKPRPFKVVDLFPIWGANPSLGIILSGPILHPGATAGSVDTLGYADLYADHTVSIRDWTGALVKPTP